MTEYALESKLNIQLKDYKVYFLEIKAVSCDAKNLCTSSTLVQCYCTCSVTNASQPALLE